MRAVILFLVFITAVLGILWVAFGGVTLAIAFGAVVFLTAILLAFGLGSWWSSQLIERGAKIALQAQNSDDRRDTVQVRALAGLVKETLRARDTMPDNTPYPILPFRDNAPEERPIEATFTVSGLDEED